MSSSFPSNDPGHSGPRLPPRPRGLAFILSIIVLVMYCGFILLVAYDKPFLASTIAPGLSWGILLGALVIVFSWVLTLIYVAVSNKRSEE